MGILRAFNEEGLLYDDEGLEKITEKFKKEKIDGLFLPHCNFGTEFECARLAKEFECTGACCGDHWMKDQMTRWCTFKRYTVWIVCHRKSPQTDSGYRLHI